MFLRSPLRSCSLVIYYSKEFARSRVVSISCVTIYAIFEYKYFYKILTQRINSKWQLDKAGPTLWCPCRL